MIKLTAKFCLLFVFLGVNVSGQLNKKPNVILFLVDDLGWTDAKVFGSNLYRTPNLDKLVSDGTSFNNAYASCTVCSPTRASIMTGKYPARLHVTDWIDGHKRPYAKMKVPNWNQKLDLEETTLAEEFRQRGYKTIHIGKWHLGEDEKYWPTKQGFDINVGGFSAGSPRADGGKGYFSPYNNSRMDDGEEDEYLTERLAKEAANYIKQNKNLPFFMNFWLYNVHLPLQAKQEKVKMFEKEITSKGLHRNATYAAMVSHMDDALGLVLQTLKEEGIENNTIVVFHSDNGGIVGNYRGKHITDNSPLKSGKGDMYEGGVRVPMVFKWPSKIKSGRVHKEPVISTDIYPTLLSLVDNKYQSSVEIDGENLKQVLLNNDSLGREAIYWHYPHYHLEGAKPYSAIRKGEWKLIQVYEHSTLELYNLKEDIGETTNLVGQYPAKAQELLSDLEKWKKQVGAQLPEVNPMFDAVKENFWLKKKHKKRGK